MDIGYCFTCDRPILFRKRSAVRQCGTCGGRDIIVAQLERVIKSIQERQRQQTFEEVRELMDRLHIPKSYRKMISDSMSGWH